MRIERLPQPGLLGPRPIPLLGPFGSMMRFFADPVRSLLELSTRYGDVVPLAQGDASLVCVFGAAHNKTILSDPKRFVNVADSPVPLPPDSAAARLLGQALTSMNGEEHRARRRMLMPVFSKSAVERYAGTVISEVDERQAQLAPGATVDVAEAMKELALAVSLRCLFGLDPGAVAGEAVGRLSLAYLEGLIDPLAMVFPVRLPGTPYARFLDTADKLEAHVRTLIQERADGADGTDVLSLLMRAHDDDGSTMSEGELIAHVTVFFVAGFETTANTLAWTLFLLSQHPEALANVQAELDEVLGERAPDPESLARLPALDAVVLESMRILPAAPLLFMRRLTEAARLGEQELPAGATVLLSPLVTHRDPAVFPEPARFMPERWKGLAPGPYSYLPFGAGPRLCIGATFAAQTTRLALASILRRATPTLVDGADVSRRVRGIVLGTKRGIPMRFVARGERVERGVPRGDIRELVDLP